MRPLTSVPGHLGLIPCHVFAYSPDLIGHTFFISILYCFGGITDNTYVKLPPYKRNLGGVLGVTQK